MSQILWSNFIYICLNWALLPPWVCPSFILFSKWKTESWCAVQNHSVGARTETQVQVLQVQPCSFFCCCFPHSLLIAAGCLLTRSASIVYCSLLPSLLHKADLGPFLPASHCPWRHIFPGKWVCTSKTRQTEGGMYLIFLRYLGLFPLCPDSMHDFLNLENVALY